jgi:hypothetical protein
MRSSNSVTHVSDEDTRTADPDESQTSEDDPRMHYGLPRARTADPGGLREAGSDSISYWQARALAAEARTADPGGLRSSLHRTADSSHWDAHEAINATFAALTPEATAPDGEG